MFIYEWIFKYAEVFYTTLLFDYVYLRFVDPIRPSQSSIPLQDTKVSYLFLCLQDIETAYQKL